VRCDLLIGWGNPLRGDDGVGQAIAAAVERWGQPQLEVVEAVQLTPELAPLLAAARRVLFVDAEAGAAAITGGWRLERSGCLGACGHDPVLRLDDGLVVPREAGRVVRVPLLPPASLVERLAALGLPLLSQAPAPAR
jgi:hypothetical protein